MKLRVKVSRQDLRLGLGAALMMAINLGCLNLLPAQPVTPMINTKPIITSTIDLTPTQANTLRPAPTGTGLPENISPVPPKKVYPSEDVVWEMLDQVDIDRALNDLRVLTGEAPICTVNGCFTVENRLTGSEGLRWAKDYVYNEMAGLGYSVEIQDWSRAGYEDQNLIARKPGKLHPEEKIYLVAHLDGVGNGEERFPAADDNASGVADLLELARIINNYSFSRTVVLLFSTGEEQGTLGVQSYLSQLSPSELDSIKDVVNTDVVGYDANQDQVMELWHGDHPPSIDLAIQVSEIIRAYQLNLEPGFVVGCGWGDEVPFREKGFPTVLQIENYEGERNPTLHTPQDTIAQLNLEYFLEQMKATTAIAANLAVPQGREKDIYLPFLVKLIH